MHVRGVVGLVLASLSACLFPSVASLGNDGGQDGAPTDGALLDAHGDQAPAGYCASLSPAPAFCDDFDDGMALLVHFDNDTLTGGGMVGLDSLLHVSPPSSMQASVPAQAGTASYPAAFVTKGFATTAQTIVATASIYLNKTDPSGNGATILAVGTDSGLFRITTHQGGANTILIDDYTPDGGVEQYPGIAGVTFTLPTQQWMTIVITVDVSKSAAGCSLDTGTGAMQVVP